ATAHRVRRGAAAATAGPPHPAPRGTMGDGMRFIALAAFLVASVATDALAAAGPAPRVHVELLSEVDSIAPGQTFWVGLRQQIAPGCTWSTRPARWSTRGRSTTNRPAGAVTCPAPATTSARRWPRSRRASP